MAVLALTPIRPHTSGCQFPVVLTLHSCHRWLEFCINSSTFYEPVPMCGEKTIASNRKFPNEVQSSYILSWTAWPDRCKVHPAQKGPHDGRVRHCNEVLLKFKDDQLKEAGNRADACTQLTSHMWQMLSARYPCLITV